MATRFTYLPSVTTDSVVVALDLHEKRTIEAFSLNRRGEVDGIRVALKSTQWLTLEGDIETLRLFVAELTDTLDIFEAGDN